MEHIEKIKSCLITHVNEQLEHLESVDTHELGEVIDIIKDLEEILYYNSMIKTETK